MKQISLNGSDWKMKEFVGMDWVWRDSVMPDTKDVRWWYPASVPGSVLHDLIQQQRVPDPYYEQNSKLAEWVPARTWVYRKEFEITEELKGKTAVLKFEGIDYQSEIFLNGVSLGRQEGMYIPWEAEVTALLKADKKNLLAVVIEPAPQEQPQVGRTSLVRTHKSRMTYWWDFCPRMIHQGIWQPVWLNITEGGVLKDVYLTADLKEAYSEAVVHLMADVQIRHSGGYRLEGSFGDICFSREVISGINHLEWNISNPRLWWTNGLGEAWQYPVRLRLIRDGEIVCDEKSFEYGIREIRFQQNEETTDSKAAFLLYVNGKKTYMNGYNWVPADVLYGACEENKEKHLLRLAKEAGVNILRVWGGGLIEKDSFYRECAKNGILIWQEFILSSSGIDNQTPTGEEYRRMLVGQAEVILKAKRNHTALAVWCGGNELQDKDGRPLDDSDCVLGALKEQVTRWDSKRKWLPTSPSGGVFLNSLENIEKTPNRLYDVHGPWEHQGLEKHCTLYNKGTSLLHTEFGVEGMTAYSTLRRVTDEKHLLPASRDNEIYFHRGAWWNNEPLVQETFGGGLLDIEQIRKGSQYLQYEGLKYAVECSRRRAFRSSGTFPWQLNEPYPNLFCTSAVDYYGIPKPAYYGMKKVYGKFRISAAFDSPILKGRQQLTAALYAGASEEVCAKNLRAWAALYDEAGALCWQEEYSIAGLDMKDKRLAEISPVITGTQGQLLLLRMRLFAGEELLAENEYLFTRGEHLKAVFFTEIKDIETKLVKDELRVTNNASTPLWFVYLTGEEEPEEFYADRNYFCILPGEEQGVHIRGKNKSIALQALNVGYRIIKMPMEGSGICR